MSLFPKFIIEKDDDELFLVIGMVSYHKNLTDNPEKVAGGGWFSKKEKVIQFHGDSHEFGRAKFEDIEFCVKNKRIFTNKYLTHDISDDHEFEYRDQVGEIYKIDKEFQPLTKS